MSEVNKKVLEPALKDGLITRQLSPNEREYLPQSIITANNIYHWLKRWGRPATRAVIAREVNLAPRVISIYLGWMRKKGLVEYYGWQWSVCPLKLW